MSDWTISEGYVVSGVFQTERERMLADAVNKSRAGSNAEMRAYDRGVEDGRAIYEPRNPIVRLLWRLFG